MAKLGLFERIVGIRRVSIEQQLGQAEDRFTKAKTDNDEEAALVAADEIHALLAKRATTER